MSKAKAPGANVREERGGWNERQGIITNAIESLSQQINISYHRGGTMQDFHSLLALLS